MAFLTATTQSHSAPFPQGLLARIGRAFVAIAENNPRYKEVQRLQALSDADLSRRGLRREDIVRHVYRDVYYL